MNKLLVLLALSFLPLHIFADSPYQNNTNEYGPPPGSASEQIFIEAKHGKMMVDLSEYQDVFSPAFALGYISEAGIGIELEAGKADGDLTIPSQFGTVPIDYSLEYQAVYVSYRSPDGSGYFKARGGLLHEDVNGFTDTGLSFGLGAGYRLGSNIATEAEVTLIEQDVNYFSIGLMAMF